MGNVDEQPTSSARTSRQSLRGPRSHSPPMPTLSPIAWDSSTTCALTLLLWGCHRWSIELLVPIVVSTCTELVLCVCVWGGVLAHTDE